MMERGVDGTAHAGQLLPAPPLGQLHIHETQHDLLRLFDNRCALKQHLRDGNIQEIKQVCSPSPTPGRASFSALRYLLFVADNISSVLTYFPFPDVPLHQNLLLQAFCDALLSAHLLREFQFFV